MSTRRSSFLSTFRVDLRPEEKKKGGVAPAGVHCAAGAHNRKDSYEENNLVARSGVMILISAGLQDGQNASEVDPVRQKPF